MLKLYGHFSYIDKYNKLKFLFNDDVDITTREKLVRCGESFTNKPYTNEGFTVALPGSFTIPPPDIVAKVGLKCNVYVKTRPYKFKSKLEKNLGEPVTGCTLTLQNIVVAQ